MEIQFEPSRSFCYKFARYVVLPEVQQMREVASGESFKLSELAQRVIDARLTPEQQQIKLKKAKSDKVDSLHSIVKFFTGFMAKELELFVALGDGFYRTKSAEDISDEDLEESALQEGDEEASDLDGWIYAFSFPALLRTDAPFPIKVGKTVVTSRPESRSSAKGRPLLTTRGSSAAGRSGALDQQSLRFTTSSRPAAAGVRMFRALSGSIHQEVRFKPLLTSLPAGRLHSLTHASSVGSATCTLGQQTLGRAHRPDALECRQSLVTRHPHRRLKQLRRGQTTPSPAHQQPTQNAAIPVIARPKISACTSCVPS